MAAPKKQRGLGKGLDALFGDAEVTLRAKTDKKDSLKWAEYCCDNWYKLNKIRENDDEIYNNLRFLSRRYLDNVANQSKVVVSRITN